MSFARSESLRALASAAMLVALAIALIPGRPMALVIALASVGVLAVGGRAAPGAVALVARRRSIVLVFLLALVILAWFVAGVLRANGNWFTPPVSRNDLGAAPLFGHDFSYASSWPWRIGRLPLIWLVLALLCAVGGFVLNADAVRVQLGYARPRRSSWRLLTSSPTRGGRIAIRAIPGVALVTVAAVIGITFMSRYIAYSHPNKALLGMAVIALISALLVAGPVAVGLTLRVDIDKEGRAREEERRRFAAHLHDSVLQTLALIQRQASDPDAVAKLARRQEHALRAWMAGETDLSSATVAGAVRDMLAEVEDEQGIKVEMTAIGDAKLDDRGEELVAAAREALRNAARHATGAPINLFLNINGHGLELFVRDSGPGFDFDAVPAERRGLRDAVIGRMSLAGGTATVESNPGDGTEIALRLPPGGRSR
ncbi:MAG: ATP-binding protein [Solirubrobacteraceae bacterium]